MLTLWTWTAIIDLTEEEKEKARMLYRHAWCKAWAESTRIMLGTAGDDVVLASGEDIVLASPARGTCIDAGLIWGSIWESDVFVRLVLVGVFRLVRAIRLLHVHSFIVPLHFDVVGVVDGASRAEDGLPGVAEMGGVAVLSGALVLNAR